jgi:hypothetical protein
MEKQYTKQDWLDGKVAIIWEASKSKEINEFMSGPDHKGGIQGFWKYYINKNGSPSGYDTTKLPKLTIDQLLGMKTHKITLNDFSKHLPLACDKWKSKLLTKYGEKSLLQGYALIEESDINDMHNDANQEKKLILKQLFPNHFPKSIPCKDMKVGQYGRIIHDGGMGIYVDIIILRTYNSFVNIFSPNTTWTPAPKFEVEIVDVEIKVKK